MHKKFEWCKYYLFPSFIIILIFICCALFLLNNLPHNNDDLIVNYSSKKVVINNDLLLTDAVGKKISKENIKVGTTGYIEFDISSRVDEKIKYEVVLSKEAADPEIPLEFVKVYLTDENDKSLISFDKNSVPTYFDLKSAESNLSGKVLYSGSFKNKGSKKFRLRVWVADTYEITATTSIFSVKLDVNVK